MHCHLPAVRAFDGFVKNTAGHIGIWSSYLKKCAHWCGVDLQPAGLTVVSLHENDKTNRAQTELAVNSKQHSVNATECCLLHKAQCRSHIIRHNEDVFCLGFFGGLV